MWILPGSYQIKVKAKDTNGNESPWSNPLPINMPRNKAINNLHWLIFLTISQCYKDYYRCKIKNIILDNN